MNDFQNEGITAITIYISISLILILAIFLAGFFNANAKEFSKKVVSQWKSSLIITGIYFISATIGSGLSAVSFIWSIGVFCQTMVGMSIAYNIDNYQPLPIAVKMSFNWKFIRSCFLMIGIAVAASIAIMITSGISMGIGRILGEASSTEEVAGLMPKNGARAFFSLFAGAGIIEGVTFRLIVVTLVWKLTQNRVSAVLIAAVIFAVYHFIPLNMMYRVYWQMPVTQFINVLLGASIIGFIYIRRGFETSILSHTFADWIPLLVYIYYM